MFLLLLSFLLPPFFLFFLSFFHYFLSSIFHTTLSGKCKCPPYAQCERDEKNFKKYKCVCPPTSSEDQSTVCGSDGRTYINRQVLERESCLIDVKISVVYSGTCSEFWQYFSVLLNSYLGIRG